MKKITVGIVAHVDSGKTTLSEGILYSAGEIKKRGRVDHGDTFLDTDNMERERGITIFAKQAVLKTGSSEITLLDTPGHVDFSAETERTLSVLDYAVLVISGTDGVQSHTETLWHILKNNNIPVFIFVNKMDISCYDRSALVANLKAKLDENCVSFSGSLDSEEFYENVAMCDEKAMHKFLETGKIEKEDILRYIKQRKIFPCFFGSALRQEGVDEFLKLFDEFTLPAENREKFGAKVFKISEDEQGNRTTHLKICGGSLKVREIITAKDKEGNEWSEKVNSIRIYSGNKFKTAEIAEQGTVCAVTGLSKTFPGQGLGEEKNSDDFLLEPVFVYKIEINDNTPDAIAFKKLKKLEEEEPQLNIFWNERLGEINIRLMGEIQCEIIKRVIKERFDIDVDFVQGLILYKETVAEAVEGVGHYEPLRHYAEVHLLIEPGERGSGVIFDSDVSEDVLAKNWQRLIMSHLSEKTHLGVLTGSVLTDVKITLISGKAHLKHTEGGDFRQATYRAVRHGLMRAKNILLEPWYSFSLELPSENLGRAMTDIEKMGGKMSLPETDGEISKLSGSAPVSQMSEYQKDVAAYTKGKGHLSLKVYGYEPVQEAQEIIEKIGYNPEADIPNSADSVFCDHGAGFMVGWQDVEKYMHLPYRSLEKPVEEVSVVRQKISSVSEEELIKIYEHTYGKIGERHKYKKMRTEKTVPMGKSTVKPKQYDKTYLLVDGYNIIFAVQELKELSKVNIDSAKDALKDMLADYQGYKNCRLMVVFDGYKRKGNIGSNEKYFDLEVVHTKQDETADAYIERTVHQLVDKYKITVVTNDGLEQLTILSQGAFRMSTDMLLQDMKRVKKEVVLCDMLPSR